jgi:hypothetical protein
VFEPSLNTLSGLYCLLTRPNTMSFEAVRPSTPHPKGGNQLLSYFPCSRVPILCLCLPQQTQTNSEGSWFASPISANLLYSTRKSHRPFAPKFLYTQPPTNLSHLTHTYYLQVNMLPMARISHRWLAYATVLFFFALFSPYLCYSHRHIALYFSTFLAAA